jgi:hypothetical protein
MSLIFSSSAFSKFGKIPFNDTVPTFEDKDWTIKSIESWL